ncbi:MAG TPA: hypothetical protein PLD79_06850, partial [Halothiobacillus sp.]|nr:hypothetical protein [Halothiobacillus sp.]
NFLANHRHSRKNRLSFGWLCTSHNDNARSAHTASGLHSPWQSGQNDAKQKLKSWRKGQGTT